MSGTHAYANVVRSLEARVFPEIAEVMADFEGCSAFLTLIDTRPGAERVVHAFRVSSVALAESRPATELGGGVGIALLDDLIASGQITAEQINRYYDANGIELAKCMSVETNFRVGDKVTTDSGLRISDLGYIAIFQTMDRFQASDGEVAIFAHLNEPAIRSLAALGVTADAIAGIEGLRTPTTSNGVKGFDDHYIPVAIPLTKSNVTIVRQLAAFAAPEARI